MHAVRLKKTRIGIAQGVVRYHVWQIRSQQEHALAPFDWDCRFENKNMLGSRKQSSHPCQVTTIHEAALLSYRIWQLRLRQDEIGGEREGIHQGMGWGHGFRLARVSNFGTQGHDTLLTRIASLLVTGHKGVRGGKEMTKEE